MKRLNNKRKYALLVVAGFLFTSCAEVDPFIQTCVVTMDYGFLSGLWHGLIIPFSWIGTLFNDSIVIYASHTSEWYDFGFVIGLIILGSSTRMLSSTSIKNFTKALTA